MRCLPLSHFSQFTKRIGQRYLNCHDLVSYYGTFPKKLENYSYFFIMTVTKLNFKYFLKTQKIMLTRLSFCSTKTAYNGRLEFNILFNKIGLQKAEIVIMKSMKTQVNLKQAVLTSMRRKDVTLYFCF